VTDEKLDGYATEHIVLGLGGEHATAEPTSRDRASQSHRRCFFSVSVHAFSLRPTQGESPIGKDPRGDLTGEGRSLATRRRTMRDRMSSPRHYVHRCNGCTQKPFDSSIFSPWHIDCVCILFFMELRSPRCISEWLFLLSAMRLWRERLAILRKKQKGRCQAREIPNSSRLGVSSAEKSSSGRGARVAESKRLSQKAAVWATGP